ncbi:MAG: MFS transporter [Alphaproteobacteria bacterium]|nr:MFS transporter [Alphaproteobacteria bacterium]
MPDGLSRRTRIALIAALCIGYVASQFYRTANAAIAPELMRELSISPESMGAVTGVFFLMFAVMQIPAGVLLDRFGPRRVMSGLLLLAVAGSLVFAVADGAPGLGLGRGLMGAGCAAGLMGSMVVFARWFPQRYFATLAAVIFSVGGIGNLMATTPLALASQAIGWRGAFVGMAAITVGMAAVLFLVLRDAPPGHPVSLRAPESPRQILRGLGQVLRDRRIWYISAMQAVAYPILMTISALWAGPYLDEVYGLDAIQRGNVLLALNVAMILGVLAYGPLDRLFDTRKWVVVAGTAVTIVVLAVMAAVPHWPLWQIIALLVVFMGLGGYQMILHAHTRAILPDHLVGRGLTVQNTAVFVGVFAMQWASGYIIGAFRDAADPALPYRVVFAFLGGTTLIALLVYLRIEDKPPSAVDAG